MSEGGSSLTAKSAIISRFAATEESDRAYARRPDTTEGINRSTSIYIERWLLPSVCTGMRHKNDNLSAVNVPSSYEVAQCFTLCTSRRLHSNSVPARVCKEEEEVQYLRTQLSKVYSNAELTLITLWATERG